VLYSADCIAGLQVDDDFNLEGALAALEAKPHLPMPKAVSSDPALTPREPSTVPSKKPQKKSKSSGGGGSFQTLFWEEEPIAPSYAADDAHAEALLAK
jgi:hypothetical protein